MTDVSSRRLIRLPIAIPIMLERIRCVVHRRAHLSSRLANASVITVAIILAVVQMILQRYREACGVGVGRGLTVTLIKRMIARAASVIIVKRTRLVRTTIMILLHHNARRELVRRIRRRRCPTPLTHNHNATVAFLASNVTNDLALNALTLRHHRYHHERKRDGVNAIGDVSLSYLVRPPINMFVTTRL